MSNVDQAVAFLQNVRNENPAIPWQLDYTQTIDRVRELVFTPAKFEQGHLNMCGPAAFFRVWFGRDPLGAATFAYRLLKSGSADLGTKSIFAPSGLLQQDYALLRTNQEHKSANYQCMPPSADWMLECSLRYSENFLPTFFGGEPHSAVDWALGITLPITVASWMTETNVYSLIDNRTTLLPDSLDHLQQLNPVPTVDLVMLVDSGFRDYYPSPLGTTPDTPPINSVPAADWFNRPNHYIVLLNSPIIVSPDQQWIRMAVWTYGQNEGGWVGADKFISKYWGVISATAA